MNIPTWLDVRRGIRKWGELLNNYYGDCVVAAYLHLSMVHHVAKASTWHKVLYVLGFKVPGNRLSYQDYQEFLATLDEIPSPTTGVNVPQFFNWLKARGDIKDWAEVPFTTDWNDAVRLGTYVGDGALVTLNLTKRAWEQGTDVHKIWSLDPGEVPDPSLGHAVANVFYRKNNGVVTWGRVKEMDVDFTNVCVNSVFIFTE